MIKSVVAIILVSALALPANASPLAINGTGANGAEFRLSAERGHVVAITLVSRYTRGELEKINEALKPELGPTVNLVTVVDFVGIPRLFFGFARMQIAAASKTTPVQFVVDDDSHWGPALGAAPDRRVDILVLDQQGELRGHFVGVDQVNAARRLMRELCCAMPSRS